LKRQLFNPIGVEMLESFQVKVAKLRPQSTGEQYQVY